MGTFIDTLSRSSASAIELQNVFRLRKEVFADRLAWKVNCTDGMEYDDFDDDMADYLVVRRDDRIIASCRLISTLHPTMLSHVFPDLLRGEVLGLDPEVVEISRLSAAHSRSSAYEALPRILSGLRSYSQARGVREYVFVTTTAIERMLRRHRLKIQRFGDGRTTNIDGVESLALRLDAASISGLQ